MAATVSIGCRFNRPTLQLLAIQSQEVGRVTGVTIINIPFTT